MGGLTGIVAIIARAVLRYQDRHLSGPRTGLDPSVRAELEDVRAQLADQHELRQRLSELEERVDFAERMLSQQRERGRLPAEG
jgi:hypothetical protein